MSVCELLPVIYFTCTLLQTLEFCTIQIVFFLNFRLKSCHRIIEWFGLEESPSTTPGCSKPRPTWPWTLRGRGHPQLLWATCASASPPSE